MEERFKFRHVNAITGTFVLVVVAVLVAAQVAAGRSQRWFIGNVTLRIALPAAGAAGIHQGSEVYFLGTLIDNVLRPVLVGNRLKLHTVLAFISAVGGLMLFGPAGLILGPVALMITTVLLEIWRQRAVDPPAMNSHSTIHPPAAKGKTA